MSTNTVKASDIQAVPFFARFLEEQVSEQSDSDQDKGKDKGKDNIATYKFPSDWEDR